MVKFRLAISQDETAGALRDTPTSPTSASRLPMKTGATASAGQNMRAAVSDMIDRTSTEASPWTHRSKRDNKRALRGSRCSRPSATGWEAALD